MKSLLVILSAAKNLAFSRAIKRFFTSLCSVQNDIYRSFQQSNRLAKQFVCDFLVYGKIIVELKAIKKISEIEAAQLLNYLKGTGLNLGLLFNFGASSLEYKRLINTNP